MAERVSTRWLFGGDDQAGPLVDPIHGRFHSVVDAALGNPAQHSEGIGYGHRTASRGSATDMRSPKTDLIKRLLSHLVNRRQCSESPSPIE